MNVEQKQSDALFMTLSINIEPDDYSLAVKKSLNEYKRNAEIKGFRKGMVPMGLIQKMHGRTALLEEVNKLISEGLNKYIEENNIKILGEPLPNDDFQTTINWDIDESFHFVFDLILAPKVELSLTADDHIPIKQPKITKKDKDEYIEVLRKQYGQLVDAESVVADEFIKADLLQGDKVVNGTFISLKTIAEESFRQPFIGLKTGDSVEIDIVKTFPNDTDRAAMLKVKKEELDNTNPLWLTTILEVKRFAPAEVNQEFFDRVFGTGQIKTQEAFIKEIEERMRGDFIYESNYRFSRDARKYVIEKCAIDLPDSLIKRWLHLSNDGKFSMEEIERDYNAFAEDFRWQLIRGLLIKEHNVQITREECLAHAVEIAKYRFAMSGMPSVPQDYLEKYAGSLLADEKEGHRIIEQVEDNKAIAIIRSKVTLDPEKVPYSKKDELNRDK